MGTWIKRHKTKYVFNHEVESMDHILEGLLASNHPDPMKRQLIDKISKKGQDQHPVNTIRLVLNLSMDWVLQGTTELQVSSGFKLFDNWAQHHLDTFENLLTRDLLVNLITKPSRNQANLPLLLTEALNLLRDHNNGKVFQQHLKIIEAKSATFVQNSPNVVCVKHYLQMLLHFKDSLPKGDTAARLALPLMQALASNPIPANEKLVLQFIRDVTSVSDFLNQIWVQSSGNLLLECLKELFSIISATEGPEPSVCLGALVRLIPSETVEKAVKTAVADSKVSDVAINTALRRMIDWLVWPTCKNIDQWIICFLKELALAKKFSILISVTESKVEQVMEKLRYASVREAAFNIISHMLLSYQHCPQPFHKILPMVPDIVAVLRNERPESCEIWLKKLAQLLHHLMFLHTGFPDLYDPIIDLIKDIPCPSTEEMGRQLTQKRWSARRHNGVNGQSTDGPDQLERSDTGKVGLYNLGNTCYMNSIVQILFMCDEFRKEALRRIPSKEEKLLDELQHIFAALVLSMRPALMPRKFLEASQPSWFNRGQQQDCSEFLKHLLGKIHEQQLKSLNRQAASGQAGTSTAVTSVGSSGASTSSVNTDSEDSTLVRKAFGFKVQSTYRCLTCQQESNRVEDFIDIPLAFPEQGSNTASSPISQKSLVGGGSHLPPGDTSKQQGCSVNVSKAASSVSNMKPTKVIHLSELLGHFLTPEKLVDDNKYHCDGCGKLQDGERTMAILDSPQYLILFLLRFAFDAKLQIHSKVFHEVTCPRTLVIPVLSKSSGSAASGTSDAAKTIKKLLNEVNPKLISSVSASADNCELYGLCSMVVHSGASSECGHYYCYGRHAQVKDVDSVIDSLKTSSSGSSQDTAEVDFLEDKWCLFNDERVSHAAQTSFSKLIERYPSDTPYGLVYKKLSFDAHDSMASGEPPLHQNLRQGIINDNTEYIKELEAAAKTKSGRSRSASTSSATFDNWRDDSDQGPPGCGGGGDLDSLAARFVF